MELPKRKHPRLKEYDYSQNGYYYVTVSTENNLPVLSTVGQGLAPADVEIKLSPIGVVAEQQLLELKTRYPYVKVDKYVIMPTHIHFVLIINAAAGALGGAAGASPRPTLCDMICAYKSLTTRECNRNDKTAGRKIFQTSFYEKVIRDEKGYMEVCNYINENPLKWLTEKEKLEQA